MLMNGKVKAAIIIFAVIVISGIISFVSVVTVAGRGDKVFPGVTVHDVNLSKMTREEANQALKDYIGTLKDKTVEVSFEGGTGSFKLSDVGADTDVSALVEKALTVGRRGNFWQQWQERKGIAKSSMELPAEIAVDKVKLQKVLDNMTKELRVPPRDAKLVITPQETVQVVESANGKGIDMQDAFDQLRSIVNEDSSPQIELRTVLLKPAQTTEALLGMRVDGEIARFSTRFDIKKTNRVYNIKVAAAALDGQLIKPGEVFSFNKVVGPRSHEAGYKLAPTILNNEFIDSLGGGVCQVSTTLYNTLLKADVDVLQRSNHSLVIKYVPLGQDAAVSYGGKDLKFKNSLPCAVVMKTAVYGNTITIKLFGDTSLKKTVKVVNNTIKDYPFKIVYKNDPTLPKGKQLVDQKGVKGYRVTSYMLVYQGGNLLRKETLPSSYYTPLDQIILVGTKPGSATPGTIRNGGTDTATEPPADQSTGPETGTEDPNVQPPVTPPVQTDPSAGTLPLDPQPLPGTNPNPPLE